MQPNIVSLRSVKDDEEVVALCVETLRKGRLVVFPTETVYGLAALASSAEAVERLCVEKGRRAGHALPIAISGYNALKRYVPNAPKLALRLANRLWPGPLTLVLDASASDGALNNLPEQSRKAIMPEGTVGIRTPQNAFLLRVLKSLDEPIVLTSANLSGKTPAKSASEARDALGEKPDLITVMLGTNDILSGISAEQTCRRMNAFISHIRSEGRPVMLIAPPHLQFGEWVQSEDYLDESRELAGLYREAAEDNGCMFADSGEWDVDISFDGVHFSEEGHGRFAEKMNEILRDCF